MGRPNASFIQRYYRKVAHGVRSPEDVWTEAEVYPDTLGTALLIGGGHCSEHVVPRVPRPVPRADLRGGREGGREGGRPVQAMSAIQYTAILAPTHRVHNNATISKPDTLQQHHHCYLYRHNPHTYVTPTLPFLQSGG